MFFYTHFDYLSLYLPWRINTLFLADFLKAQQTDKTFNKELASTIKQTGSLTKLSEKTSIKVFLLIFSNWMRELFQFPHPSSEVYTVLNVTALHPVYSYLPTDFNKFYNQSFRLMFPTTRRQSIE